jgi:hypothetical protein
MRQAVCAKLRPVVIDESLLDLESLRLAKEKGYTDAALKACKGQSQSLLMAAAAQKDGMFMRSGPDLSRSVVAALGEPRRACAGDRGDRSQFPAVLSRGQCGLGEAVSGDFRGY